MARRLPIFVRLRSGTMPRWRSPASPMRFSRSTRIGFTPAPLRRSIGGGRVSTPAVTTAFHGGHGRVVRRGGRTTLRPFGASYLIVPCRSRCKALQSAFKRRSAAERWQTQRRHNPAMLTPAEFASLEATMNRLITLIIASLLLALPGYAQQPQEKEKERPPQQQE